MKGLIGKKVGMTQVFDDDGNRVPVTVIEVGGNVVVQKKSAKGKDGYAAVKLGYGDVHKREKEGEDPQWRMNAPQLGVFLKAGLEEPKQHLREVRVTEPELDEYEIGQELGADVFQKGDFVDVTGTSKGRGYSGVMRRHNFHGAKASHGVHEYFRHGGAIGASAYPARVVKGKKMPGQYGGARVTLQNLSVVDVRPEDNAVLVKGGVPGPNGGIVTLRTAIKKLQAG